MNVLYPDSTSTTMDLSWLVGRRFVSALQRENDWVFTLDGGVTLTAECLWRLIEDGVIRCTDRDDGHQFGLPERVDASARVGDSLGGLTIVAASFREGALDLSLHFEAEKVLELIPDSSGYEAWQLAREGEFFVAGGGGLVSRYLGGVAGD